MLCQDIYIPPPPLHFMLIKFFCLVGTLHDLAVGYSSFLAVHYKWGVREPLDFMNITSLCVGAWPSEPWKRIFKFREESFLSVHKYTVYVGVVFHTTPVFSFSYYFRLSEFISKVLSEYTQLCLNLSLVHTFPSPNPTMNHLWTRRHLLSRRVTVNQIYPSFSRLSHV